MAAQQLLSGTGVQGAQQVGESGIVKMPNGKYYTCIYGAAAGTAPGYRLYYTTDPINSSWTLVDPWAITTQTTLPVGIQMVASGDLLTFVVTCSNDGTSTQVYAARYNTATETGSWQVSVSNITWNGTISAYIAASCAVVSNVTWIYLNSAEERVMGTWYSRTQYVKLNSVGGVNATGQIGTTTEVATQNSFIAGAIALAGDYIFFFRPGSNGIPNPLQVASRNTASGDAVSQDVTTVRDNTDGYLHTFTGWTTSKGMVYYAADGAVHISYRGVPDTSNRHQVFLRAPVNTSTGACTSATNQVFNSWGAARAALSLHSSGLYAVVQGESNENDWFYFKWHSAPSGQGWSSTNWLTDSARRFWTSTAYLDGDLRAAVLDHNGTKLAYIYTDISGASNAVYYDEYTFPSPPDRPKFPRAILNH